MKKHVEFIASAGREEKDNVLSCVTQRVVFGVSTCCLCNFNVLRFSAHELRPWGE